MEKHRSGESKYTLRVIGGNGCRSCEHHLEGNLHSVQPYKSSHRSSSYTSSKEMYGSVYEKDGETKIGRSSYLRCCSNCMLYVRTVPRCTVLCSYIYCMLESRQ